MDTLHESGGSRKNTDLCIASFAIMSAFGSAPDGVGTAQRELSGLLGQSGFLLLLDKFYRHRNKHFVTSRGPTTLAGLARPLFSFCSHSLRRCSVSVPSPT